MFEDVWFTHPIFGFVEKGFVADAEALIRKSTKSVGGPFPRFERLQPRPPFGESFFRDLSNLVSLDLTLRSNVIPGQNLKHWLNKAPKTRRTVLPRLRHLSMKCCALLTADFFSRIDLPSIWSLQILISSWDQAEEFGIVRALLDRSERISASWPLKQLTFNLPTVSIEREIMKLFTAAPVTSLHFRAEDSDRICSNTLWGSELGSVLQSSNFRLRTFACELPLSNHKEIGDFLQSLNLEQVTRLELKFPHAMLHVIPTSAGITFTAQLRKLALRLWTPSLEHLILNNVDAEMLDFILCNCLDVSRLVSLDIVSDCSHSRNCGRNLSSPYLPRMERARQDWLPSLCWLRYPDSTDRETLCSLLTNSPELQMRKVGARDKEEQSARVLESFSNNLKDHTVLQRMFQPSAMSF